VTFLFSDVEGSTRLAAALGPRFPGLLDRHHALLRQAFLGAGGIEVGTEGDAFFVVFRSARDAATGTVALFHRTDGTSSSRSRISPRPPPPTRTSSS
jgi:class 3 adenylate cyclase